MFAYFTQTKQYRLAYGLLIVAPILTGLYFYGRGKASDLSAELIISLSIIELIGVALFGLKRTFQAA